MIFLKALLSYMQTTTQIATQVALEAAPYEHHTETVPVRALKIPVSANCNPRLDTLSALLHATGLRLSVTPTGDMVAH